MDSAEEVINKGYQLIEEGDSEEAVDFFEQALERFGDDPEIKTGLAEALLGEARDQEAETLLRQVLKKHPTHERAVFSLGRYLDSCLQVDEAIKLYKKQLREEPKSHQVAEDLCRILMEEGRTEEAMRIAERQPNRFSKEWHSYDAIRRVLMLEEVSLDHKAAADGYEIESSRNLANNLLLQLKHIESMFESLPSEALEREERTEELHHEIQRITAELEHLLEAMEKRGWKFPKDFRQRIQSAVKRGEKRIKEG
ncbi:MAG: tetratricopeptide repeat protein [Candidatus Lokiarchaeota archaeon]|nr:tetratricopeptide repeat protein [Candidatus Lokiarchaeota archaeon]